MSVSRGFRFGRHFSHCHTKTGDTTHVTDLAQALSRISLLAGGMVAASLFELLLLGVVKKLVPGFHPPGQDVGIPMMLIIMGISAVAFFVSRAQRIPFKVRFISSIAYVFIMVIVISAAEVSTPWWTDGGQYNGMPWVCIWLLLVPIVVPIRWEKALVRGLLLSVLPVAVLFLGVRWAGLPPAPMNVYLAYFLPCLVVTAMALIVAKMMYTLTRQVHEAKQLGSYELEEKIGAGGMGEVWRARHRMLVRPAAVKLIRPESLGQETNEHGALVERFQREAQATASLRSPHTVELFDFGVADDGTLFYVMELLAGLDLQALVDRFGPLEPARVIYLMRQMCDSLADAHANGLLHRDIKPANIFVCRAGEQRDFVKVLDFGLVKSLTPDQQDLDLTMHAAMPGTPSVMAPEVVSGQAADHRLDIYGLACVGYWLLTGSQVFSAESPLAMAVAHAKDEPAAPSTRSELTIPPTLDRIILDCLAKNPGDRPSSAAELSERLDECSCDNDWTSQQAKSWWDMHLPELGAVTKPAAVVNPLSRMG
jgi:eukaryotic-like serine/threonine-protein kinase